MIAGNLYDGMHMYNPTKANVRYAFLPTDHASLYRKAAKSIDIDSRELPQYNIDDWLNPESSRYNPEVFQAVFYYPTRVEAGERFEICVATLEMDQAAHKYAHHSQMILDSTFGICSSRLLLFIAMAIDEDRKGLPIAFFLFSAAAEAKATHASYDPEVLTRLMSRWKAHLTQKFGDFEPFSYITDTDTKERGALLAIFPRIILLICKFHLRQRWTNNRKKRFRSNENTGRIRYKTHYMHSL